MENKTFYALVLGALAVAAAIGSVASVSFASAQTGNETAKTVTVMADDAGVLKIDHFSPVPQINGTINAGEQILSKVNVNFVDAANTASKAGKGHVIGGSLSIEQGYVVYVFRVISGDLEKTVIVDAGNGEVLHTSEGFKVDMLSAISGPGHFGFAAMPFSASADLVKEAE
ncbi:MAG: PepSY domain-containing protein [Nitrososphaera sp.]|uniref:PepSY domain-containing protein n=1 Tax=Nitrososphaera sp. TaxID=1971748 RepID=UPI003D6E1E68